MHYVPAIIIGAGQAGLAMSHCLGRRRIDHIVLERGQIGERWRSERWDTLRLLTPNWMSRLPGWSYHGDDPDGFMTAPEFVGYLEAYAAASRAAVQAGAGVISVRPPRVGTALRRAGASGKRVPSLSPQAIATCPGFQPWRNACLDGSTRSPHPSTGTPNNSGMALCWWSALRQPACSLRRRSDAQAGPSPSQWGATPGYRGATVGATLGGGSNRPACSTKRRPRFRTCSAPAPNLPFSS
jgi:hypothetical protein